MLAATPPSRHLIADKGYDSVWLRGWLEMRGTEAVIPPRANRNIQYGYEKKLYRERNLIERKFCRLNDFRRIATRFDRNLKSYLADPCLNCAYAQQR